MAGPVAGQRAAGATLVNRMWLRLYLALAAASAVLAAVMSAGHMPATTPQAFPVRFYQRVVGSHDGRSCPSYPVCSAYARQAFDVHGLLFGSWLALDRLIHEGGDLRRARKVWVDGRVRSYDPLSRNDFWIRE